MNMKLEADEIPDYFVAQFPGGGQRGFATALLLKWFEKVTGLPTHQLFPYVTTGSVGILIAAALYIPHPDHPNAARMSAAQLVDIFPDIASKIPKKAAMFTNKNDRGPFSEVLELFIGDARLKDLLGTVFFSAHEIGGVSSSHKLPAKIIHPFTAQTTYNAAPDMRIMDIALAGTALPSIFQAYNGHIDLAFAETHAEPLQTSHDLFPNSAKGAFVRVGNFRPKVEKSRNRLHSSGFLRQTAAIFDAISDHSYAQTIGNANRLFQGLVFNLEQEIPEGYDNPPAIKANITTPEQFAKVRIMTEKYIEDNLEILSPLAAALKSVALTRMESYPETAFGIPPLIQEFPLPEIPKLAPKQYEETSHAFRGATVRLAKGLSQALADAARNPTLQQKIALGRDRFSDAVGRATEVLLPPRP